MRFGTIIVCMCMGMAVGCVPSEDGSGDGRDGGQGSCMEDDCGSNTARGIGDEGGVVSHRSGVTLVVPAGALSEHVELSVEEVIDRATLTALPEGFNYISGAFALLPQGQSFSAPVEVLLPFLSLPDVPETRVVRLDDRSDTEWETVEGASITTEGATFSLDRLGVYAVVGGQGPAPDPWPDCQYPVGPAAPAHNEVIPNLSWDIAYKEDGVPITFSMREVYCSEEYADVETILFFATADWCPSCPFYMEYIRDLIDAFMEANTLIVWIEVEDRNYNIASSSHALEHVNRIIGDTPGIRVGDEDTLPGPAFFDDSPLVPFFPSQFVVRKRDMKVVVSWADEDALYPVLQTVRHPEADWSNPGDNVLPTNVGAPCSNDADCDIGTLYSYCMPASSGWSQGYCVGFGCNSDAACGDSGQICNPDWGDDNLSICLQGCTPENAEQMCRPGYTCRRSGILGPRSCRP